MSIEVKDVIAGYYRDVDVLHGASLYAEKSKITGIIGPNGAGKSTLLKTIYGFLKPKQGTILYDGEDITGLDPYALPLKGVSYVLQRRSIFPLLTVRKNLKMGAWIFRKDKKRIREYLSEVYNRFPVLKERENVKAGALSGGEQRMLELSRALIIRPKTILLDEPTAGLAPKVAMGIYRKLEEIKGEGITILFVDQNIKQAIKLSDYVYVLKSGRITLEGSSEEFHKKSRTLIKDWLI